MLMAESCCMLSKVQSVAAVSQDNKKLADCRRLYPLLTYAICLIGRHRFPIPIPGRCNVFFGPPWVNLQLTSSLVRKKEEFIYHKYTYTSNFRL